MGEVSVKTLFEAKIALLMRFLKIPGAPRGGHAERNGARSRAFASDGQVYICRPKRFRG